MEHEKEKLEEMLKKLEQRVANKKRTTDSVEPTTSDPAAKKRNLH